MLTWDAALDSESLLTKSNLERMWTPTPLKKGEPAGYGFGWQIGKVNGHRLVSHGGGIPGFATELSRFVDDKLTVIVLANSDQGNAGSLAQGIARRIQPNLAKKPEEPIADTGPKTSERLKNVVLEGMKGEADPELFTEDARKEVVPKIRQAGKDGQFSAFGPLKTFAPLARKETETGVQLRYRAVFENETFRSDVHPGQEWQDRGPSLTSVGRLERSRLKIRSA